MAAKAQLFSPKQVAQALAVSESSVKRWCDCRKIPAIQTSGGHRRISLEGLYQFLKDSDRRLEHPDVLGLPPLCTRREMHIPGADQPVSQNFRDALVAGEESKCRQIARQQRCEGRAASTIAKSLMTDAMHAVGEAWGCDAVNPYQERRACEICMRIIRELLDDLPPADDDAPVAIGGALAGDPYQLPTAMVELTLRECGWNATNLGNNLPLDCFYQAVHDVRPRLVWISVSSVQDPEAFIQAQREFAESLDDDIVLLLGGRALNDEIRPHLLYTSYCDSLEQLRELAKIFAATQAA